MRFFMVMAALSWSPALAAPPPLCTLPAPIVIPVANGEAEPPTFAAQRPLPDNLAWIPFVQHVASAGAAVTDLGQSHGMHAVAARTGDLFMLFEVTPDGQAGVSGVPVELTRLRPWWLAAAKPGNRVQPRGWSPHYRSCGRRFSARPAPLRLRICSCSSTRSASIRSARCRCCNPMWRLAAFRFRSFPYPCSTKRTKVRALAVRWRC